MKAKAIRALIEYLNKKYPYLCREIVVSSDVVVFWLMSLKREEGEKALIHLVKRYYDGKRTIHRNPKGKKQKAFMAAQEEEATYKQIAQSAQSAAYNNALSNQIGNFVLGEAYRQQVAAMGDDPKDPYDFGKELPGGMV
jgi:hypothetical protein